MKFCLASVSLLLLSSFSAFAQLGSNPVENEQNLRALANLNPYSAGARSFDDRYEGVRGTPLLFAEMTPVEVIPAGQDAAISGLSGNLDMEKNLLYLKFKDGAIGSIPASDVQSVMASGPNGKHLLRSFPIQEVEGLKEEGSAFYEVLHEGQLLFLKHTRKNFQKANYQGAYSPDRRYDEYVGEVSYFVRSGKDPFEKVKLKEKALTKALPAYEDDIKRIAKKQNLNLDTEAGVVALFQELEL